MSVMTAPPAVPAHVTVEMLLGITSSIARLDAKFDAKFKAITVSIADLKSDVAVLQGDVSELKADVAGLKHKFDGLSGRVGFVEADVRQLLDWKQRILGMVLVLGIFSAVAPLLWKVVLRLFPD
jgi:hypothetical protein